MLFSTFFFKMIFMDSDFNFQLIPMEINIGAGPSDARTLQRHGGILGWWIPEGNVIAMCFVSWGTK